MHSLQRPRLDSTCDVKQFLLFPFYTSGGNLLLQLFLRRLVFVAQSYTTIVFLRPRPNPSNRLAMDDDDDFYLIYWGPASGVFALILLIRCCVICSRSSARQTRQPQRLNSASVAVSVTSSQSQRQRQQQYQPSQPTPAQHVQVQQPAGVPCVKCAHNLPAGARFCVSCGADQTATSQCVHCNTSIPSSAAFCYTCGRARDAAAPPPSYSATLN